MSSCVVVAKGRKKCFISPKNCILQFFPLYLTPISSLYRKRRLEEARQKNEKRRDKRRINDWRKNSCYFQKSPIQSGFFGIYRMTTQKPNRAANAISNVKTGVKRLSEKRIIWNNSKKECLQKTLLFSFLLEKLCIFAPASVPSTAILCEGFARDGALHIERRY